MNTPETATQMTAMLFAGQPEAFGGLSNENELARECPDQFKDNNPWSRYAMQLFYRGGNIANWKYKSDDPMIRAQQKSCFAHLLGTYSLPHEDKQAVAGWMLSEMLTEVPEHIPNKET